jgi:uncharacterized protein YeaO (DUF488 family)
MQAGKRSAAWDHTAALITHLRKCHGDKKAEFAQFQPYIDDLQEHNRQAFKKISRAAQDKQGR